jgi:hypothetical protein
VLKSQLQSQSFASNKIGHEDIRQKQVTELYTQLLKIREDIQIVHQWDRGEQSTAAVAGGHISMEARVVTSSLVLDQLVVLPL